MTGHYNLNGLKNTDQVVFFSTGTGEAPHNAMIWELLTKGHKNPIVSCVCTRYRADQAYRSLHEKLEKQFNNYKVIYLATREKEEPKMVLCFDIVKFMWKCDLLIPVADRLLLLSFSATLAAAEKDLEKSAAKLITPAAERSIALQ